MRVGLFIIIIFHFLCTNIHSQEVNTKKLDSLLLSNNIEEFLAVYEESIDTDALHNKTDKMVFYQKVISRLNDIQNITPLRSDRYISIYSKLSSAFAEENAGFQSNRAFENFLRFLSKNDTLSALKQVTIAFCFREKFIKDKRGEILNKYEKANFYYDRDNPDSAIIMLKGYNEEINSVESLSYIKDSLKIRSNLLREKLLKRKFELQQMKYPIISDKFQISYSFGINVSPQIRDKYWPYVDPRFLDHILIKTGGLKSHFNAEHTLTFGYFVFNNLSAAAEYSFGGLRYLSPALADGFLSKGTYTAKKRMFNVMFNHYFNNHIGFRWFMAMGFGYADFDLKIDVTQRYVPWYVYELDKDQMKQHTTLLLLRLGTDYLLPKPNLIFGIHLNYTYIVEDIFYINQNIFKLSLSTGFHF